MIVRKATQEDIPAITALERVCFPADPWPTPFFHRAWQAGGLLAAVEDSGGVIGYAIVSAVLDEGSLDNLAVAPEHRRRGVADALLSAVEAQARDRALRFITLEVRAGNTAARALYQKHGFVQVGLRTNYYEKPREDAILMTLVLP